MVKRTVKVLVVGGKATPGPPLGPALGGLGLDIRRIVSEVNEKTKQFEGMKVPVEITVDLETKEYEVKVGVPPTSVLILRELGVEKGSGETPAKIIGDLKFDQVVKIAKLKMESTTATDLKKVVKMVLGTAVSMGVTVEGKDPREIQREVDEGLWDDAIK